MEDCGQLPLVKMGKLYDNNPGKSGTAGLTKNITLSEFLFPRNISEAIFRQDNMESLSILDHMKNIMLTATGSNFIASRCLDMAKTVEMNTFRQKIHILPIWKYTHDLVLTYLMEELSIPLIKIISLYNTLRLGGKNHMVK